MKWIVATIVLSTVLLGLFFLTLRSADGSNQAVEGLLLPLLMLSLIGLGTGLTLLLVVGPLAFRRWRAASKDRY